MNLYQSSTSKKGKTLKNCNLNVEDHSIKILGAVFSPISNLDPLPILISTMSQALQPRPRVKERLTRGTIGAWIVRDRFFEIRSMVIDDVRCPVHIVWAMVTFSGHVCVCVCVQRLQRRKASAVPGNIRFSYIIVYSAGGHRGPGGTMANEDAHRVPRKRTCVAHLDGSPLRRGRSRWPQFVYIYIYIL